MLAIQHKSVDDAKGALAYAPVQSPTPDTATYNVLDSHSGRTAAAVTLMVAGGAVQGRPTGGAMWFQRRKPTTPQLIVEGPAFA